MKDGRRWSIAIVVASGILVSGCSGRPAQEALHAWAEAGAAYAQTNYSKAIRLYRKAEELGYAPGELYYNLGNAYYREGKLGRAICAYRQAQWLLPRDGDVAANLATARRAVKEQLSVREVPASVQAFLFFYFHVSPDESVWMFVIVTVVLFGGLAIQAFVRSSGLRQVWMGVGVVWVVLGISAGVHSYRVLRPDGAVVIAEEAAVRSGPAGTETVLFALHDGAEVEVLSREGEWYKIRAAAQKGWIAAGDVSMITVRRR